MTLPFLVERRIIMAKKNRGRFINPSAKKYTTSKTFKMNTSDGVKKVSLKQKQAVANKYLKIARENLGTNHRSYTAVMDRVHAFQKFHGQSKRPTLSMESLKTGDIDIYNQLLDSIIDSTYTNPEKYEKHKTNQLGFAIEKGWAKNQKEAEEIYNFRNSDLFAQLEDLGLSDVPSEILDKAAKYGQADLSLDDFKKMTQTFLRAYDTGDETSNTYFDYADKFMKAKSQRKDDFDKALNEYLKDDTLEDSFLVFLSKF